MRDAMCVSAMTLRGKIMLLKRTTCFLQMAAVSLGLWVGEPQHEAFGQVLKPSPALPSVGNRVEPVLPGQNVPVSIPVPYRPTDPKFSLVSSPRQVGVTKVDDLSKLVGGASPSLQSPVALPTRAVPPIGNIRAVPQPIIVGRDDRVRVTNTTAAPWSGVCFLMMQFPDGAVYVGTGFFISQRTVFTCGHNLYSHKNGGWATGIAVIPGRNGTVSPLGGASQASLTTTNGWIKNGDFNYDFGAIVLSDSTLGSRVSKFGYYAAPDSFLLNPQVQIHNAGYPGDKQSASSSFFPMYYVGGRCLGANATLIAFDNDSYKGQSGSPLWVSSEGRNYVVGILTHERGDVNYANFGTRVNASVFNMMRSLP